MNIIFPSLCAAALLALLPISAVTATTITLYDDAHPTQPLPADQRWLLYGAAGGTANQFAVGAGVNLVTDDNASAGYSNWFFTPPGSPISLALLKDDGFPVLDRTQGFSLSFELQVNSESHVSSDRAGFSVILLGNDSQGIEIGFWADEVWAQNDAPLFTHGEGTAFDTTLDEVLYDLTILGDDYLLTADGNPLLQGMVRDYTSFTGHPYTLNNFLFLGDNTSSAQANIALGEVILRTPMPAAVPAPPVWALLLLGLAVMARGQRPRRSRLG